MDKQLLSGVYAFWCPAEGRAYVGGSINIEKRKTKHVYRLRAGKHSNRLLQEAFDEHGETGLVFETLETCEPELVASAERKWVERLAGCLFDPPTAALTSGVPGKGLSADIRAKISSALIGQAKSLEHRINLWNNRIGWKHSDESRAKISAGLLAASARGNRSGPPDGWKHSKESKEKMSKTRKGKPKSPEHRAKIAAAIKAARARKKGVQ